MATLVARVVPLPRVTSRAWPLVERNLLVYRRAWMLIVSGFFEPLFYLLAVGFGIGTPAQAAAAARYADGVVVGSALMDALAQGGVSAAEHLARELAAAVHA